MVGLHEESILVQAVVGWYIYIYNMNSQGVNAKCSAGQWRPVILFIDILLSLIWRISCFCFYMYQLVLDFSHRGGGDLEQEIPRAKSRRVDSSQWVTTSMRSSLFSVQNVPKLITPETDVFLHKPVPPVHKSCWIYLILVAPNPNMQWPSWPAHVAEWLHSSLAESPWTSI